MIILHKFKDIKENSNLCRCGTWSGEEFRITSEGWLGRCGRHNDDNDDQDDVNDDDDDDGDDLALSWPLCFKSCKTCQGVVRSPRQQRERALLRLPEDPECLRKGL